MKRMFQAVVIAIALAACVSAQDKPAEKPREERPLTFYKLEFVLRELQDQRTLNTRNYSMIVENNGNGQVQSGSRVPTRSEAVDKSPQYLDVGVNINCYRLVAREDYVLLQVIVEISSFALPEQSANSSTSTVLKNARASLQTVVPVGKPTVIASIDDANSTKRYEIAVTATKMK